MVVLRIDEGIDAIVLEESQVVGRVVYRGRSANVVKPLSLRKDFQSPR